MSKKLAFPIIFFLAAMSSFAADPVRRTVIVHDGKVVLDEGAPAGKRAFIGVAMTDLTPDLREFFGAPKDAGVLVSSVVADGPAVKAGLRVGDVITAVNGSPVASSWSLADAMKDKHAGDAIRLDVIRGKARQTIVATAEERDLPKIWRTLDLGRLERELGTAIPGAEWRARLSAPETEELRTRIRDLEIRLQELEKKLQQK